MLSLAACGEDTSARKIAVEKVLAVQIFTVENQTIQREITAVGTVRYRRETPLGFT